MEKNSLTQAELKKELHYNPETGVFTWLRNGRKRRKDLIAGCVDRVGNTSLWVKGGRYTAHRLAFLYMDGVLPPEQVIHINHDLSDNRWSNLAPATRREIQRSTPKQNNNTSGVTGVYKIKDQLKWKSYIIISKKYINLGRFNDFFEAVCARKRAELTHEF